jgi:hypothetical protein
MNASTKRKHAHCVTQPQYRRLSEQVQKSIIGPHLWLSMSTENSQMHLPPSPPPHTHTLRSSSCRASTASDSFWLGLTRFRCTCTQPGTHSMTQRQTLELEPLQRSKARLCGVTDVLMTSTGALPWWAMLLLTRQHFKQSILPAPAPTTTLHKLAKVNCSLCPPPSHHSRLDLRSTDSTERRPQHLPCTPSLAHHRHHIVHHFKADVLPLPVTVQPQDKVVTATTLLLQVPAHMCLFVSNV